MSTLSVTEPISADPQPATQALTILHVVAPTQVGGLERVVHALATGQRAAGHRVSVAVILGSSPHPFVQSLADSGVAVVPLELPPRAYLRERAAVGAICRR